MYVSIWGKCIWLFYRVVIIEYSFPFIPCLILTMLRLLFIVTVKVMKFSIYF